MNSFRISKLNALYLLIVQSTVRYHFILTYFNQVRMLRTNHPDADPCIVTCDMENSMEPRTEWCARLLCMGNLCSISGLVILALWLFSRQGQWWNMPLAGFLALIVAMLCVCCSCRMYEILAINICERSEKNKSNSEV